MDLQLAEIEQNLPTILNQVWPVVTQARQEVGFAQTSIEMDLGNLQFSGETPITWLSQCYSQGEQKAAALKEAYWNFKESKLKIEKLRNKGDELSLLKADRIAHGLEESEHYIKTAYKDLIHYQQTAARIREKFNLPEQLSEEDLKENSKREHVRLSMRQALRDMENTGTISKGVSEHLEHYGIHPMTARMLVMQYRESVQKLFADGMVPTMDHLHEWLDLMEENLIQGTEDQLKYMRLVDEEPATDA